VLRLRWPLTFDLEPWPWELKLMACAHGLWARFNEFLRSAGVSREMTYEYEYTKPRAPIAAMCSGPGPSYGLPGLTGRSNHDPSSRFVKAPAFHFGSRSHGDEHTAGPGPCYMPQPKVWVISLSSLDIYNDDYDYEQNKSSGKSKSKHVLVSFKLSNTIAQL